MIIALVEYINRYGNITVKSFSTEETLNKFISRLEQRGVKHLVTRM